MDPIRAADFVSPERIKLEIQRRAFAMAQAQANDIEDPHTEASRQVFEELLMHCAERRNAA